MYTTPLLCAVLLFANILFCKSQGAPNAIYEASSYSSVVASVENGILYKIEAPNSTSLKVIHTYGNASERGYAYGQLMADQMIHFLDVDIINFYKSEIDSIPLDKLPQWLASAISGMLKDAAPEAFSLALGWVYNQQVDYIKASKANVLQEGAAMVEGLCNVRKNYSKCSNKETKNKLLQSLYHVNMLPELIRMQCSMMGAWGNATALNHGNLVQLRTLDFGTGPFANNSILVVHHPSDSFSFASLTFPAFLGVVSGFSEHIGFSEKVDDVTGSTRPKGTFKGQSVALVIRDILQFSRSKEEGVSIAQSAHRTWSVWMGLGDFSSQKFIAMLYDEDAASPYDDQTLPLLTNQTKFLDVAYIDKHPQPSPHVVMPQLVEKYYGDITPNAVASNFPRLMQSGDVHALVYDFGGEKALISTGITNSSGQYTRLACNSPFLSFNMNDLWKEKQPETSKNI